MNIDSSLLTRIRGEYGEMPGLRLTFAQACRLWHVDADTCQTVLEDLLAQRFLHRTRDGAYCASAETRGVQVTAAPVRPVARRAEPRQRA
jgi:hypothetical protein